MLRQQGRPLLQEQRAGESRRSISLRKSLSLMLRYAPTPMDPFDTVSDPERMEDRDQLPGRQKPSQALRLSLPDTLPWCDAGTIAESLISIKLLASVCGAARHVELKQHAVLDKSFSPVSLRKRRMRR